MYMIIIMMTDHYTVCTTNRPLFSYNYYNAHVHAHMWRYANTKTFTSSHHNMDNICDRICKKGSYTRNYKYLEIPI